MSSTTSARAAITERARAWCTNTGARRSWFDVLHHWRTCCDHGRSWCDELHPCARAASTARAGAICSTTGARAAIIVGARTMCSITGAEAAVTAGDSAMYSTTGAGATPGAGTLCTTTAHTMQSRQELARRAPPLAQSCRRAQRQDSLDRHVHAGYAVGLEPELRHGPHAYLAPLLTDVGRSTVGPARMGATKPCLDERVMTENKETMCLENCDTTCLGEWSSSDVGPGAAKPQVRSNMSTKASSRRYCLHRAANRSDDITPIAPGHQAA